MMKKRCTRDVVSTRWTGCNVASTFRWTGALLVLGCATAGAAQQQVTHVDATTAAAGGRAFATSPTYSVQMLKRTAPGESEVHARETDIFYVIDGDATLVTGGRMVGGRETQPNQLRGTSIDGGDTRRIRKGDVIVVPAGVPHWFKEIHQPVSYFTVKSITP
jgi:mannose-6-phosphate isomerase-like protein (cupin superfamily)